MCDHVKGTVDVVGLQTGAVADDLLLNDGLLNDGYGGATYPLRPFGCHRKWLLWNHQEGAQKVRRRSKSDSLHIPRIQRQLLLQVFARKELNFERMTERDRKQIVAEVCAPSLPFYTDHTNPQKLRNILKDLQHEHIVRYHDRYVDRDAGMLYILMEYCGGGDLSTVIKQAQRHGRPIPEDTIWNYFMQLLLALNHCHHPQNPGRHSSGSSSGEDSKERRPQILHRDLKPDNGVSLSFA
ncbi:hypothetical protein PHLCEN_2v1480 [Hermanssonia centrifuga]|uniref:non-specific serine/threonine protein kinase n=1 Tax=Hermanssonia centrifuga TaxID=98765 RepID=A0A2R6S008_9APHY|nr:hypothetical protein PHLCEN_2v1480 [Hermanssonia centrifuga]